MVDGFGYVVIGCSLALAAWGFATALLDRRPGRPLLGGLGVLEALLFAQVVVAVVLLARGERPGSLATFVGYLVASLFVLPVGAVWALAERSRSGTAVLGLACLVVPVLVLRLGQVWAAGNG